MPKKSELSVGELITNEEAGRELNVSRTTIWQWAKDGTLSAVKLGASVFFRRSDVERLKQYREARTE